MTRPGRLNPDKLSLTPERLRELLHYDPQTGKFTRLIAPNYRYLVGSIAGYISGYGYNTVTVDGHLYRGGRLAWFYVHGHWPDPMVDHINGDRSDDRLCNLREATNSNNQANCKGSDSKGVTRFRNRKWQAQITCRGRHYHLGHFDTKDAAREAYIVAARRLFGTFARVY